MGDFTTKSEEFDSVDMERFWGNFTLRVVNLDFIVEELVGVGFRKGVPPYVILTVIFDRTCSVLLNTCHTGHKNQNK